MPQRPFPCEAEGPSKRPGSVWECSGRSVPGRGDGPGASPSPETEDAPRRSATPDHDGYLISNSKKQKYFPIPSPSPEGFHCARNLVTQNTAHSEKTCNQNAKKAPHGDQKKPGMGTVWVRYGYKRKEPLKIKGSDVRETGLEPVQCKKSRETCINRHHYHDHISHHTQHNTILKNTFFFW